MNFKNEKSFTLIELLIVMGILAILGVVVILVLNPVEYLKQARDSTRISDLQTINKALGLYQADGKSSFGSSSIVYVSIPDSSSTCSNLGLPTPPSGWFYHCVSSSTLRNVNSTGWIPVDFTSVSWGVPLNILPIDPVNTTSSGQYYTYVTGASWELNAIFESQRYRLGGSMDKTSTDGGDNYGLLEIGTNLTLSPLKDTGLVGYWKFDETSGTLYDSSGYGNNGTQSGGVTYGATGKVGNALSFNGSSNYVNIGDPVNDILDFGAGSFTILAWIKPSVLPNTWKSIVNKGASGAVGYGMEISSGNSLTCSIDSAGGTNQHYAVTGALAGEWQHFVCVFDRTDKIYGFLNGNLIGVGSAYDAGNNNSVSCGNPFIIGSYGGGSWNFNGSIDDVRIYNRALSAAEISAIYNATK